jgi:signal transduction histidine kinase
VQVSDTGEGIFSGDIPDLFLPFRRMDRNATSPHGGAGIGLYLVKAVLEAQGGTVWVRSRLGKGSTFGFRLPAARRP